jgi:3-oxoacyl-[acyl-carrier-protein] synthase I
VGQVQACITAFGASTPIGPDARRTSAAARAGVCGFHAHPYAVDTAGEPIKVALVPWLDVGLPPLDRMRQMLCPAIDESLRGTIGGGRIGLALALPAMRPGRPDALGRILKAELARLYAGRLDIVHVSESGHAAGVAALDLASSLLSNGELSACVVAGVDSYLAPETLRWLEASEQLHGGGALNNAWGFIPGEAAGALLLRPADANTDRWADLLSVGLGHEDKLIKSNSVCIGAGLTEALRNALAELPQGQLVANVYCDMNGEAYRADEYGFAVLRTRERFRDAADFAAPADCWGDIGAAGVPLHLMLAASACRKGHAKGELSLVWASSEGGERGATVIRAPVATKE